jgi:hypothetical protein
MPIHQRRRFCFCFFNFIHHIKLGRPSFSIKMFFCLSLEFLYQSKICMIICFLVYWLLLSPQNTGFSRAEICSFLYLFRSLSLSLSLSIYIYIYIYIIFFNFYFFGSTGVW